MASPSQRGPQRLGLLFCIGALTYSLGCGPNPEEIATYSEQKVLASEFTAWMTFRGREIAPKLPIERLEAFISTRLLADGARENGLHQTPAIKILLERQELASWRAALRQYDQDRIEISETAVLDYLDEHRELLQKPRKAKLWNIFKRVPSSASTQERQRIRTEVEGLRERVLAGASFQALAMAESDSQTRFRGGKMGAVSPGMLRPEIDAVAFSLEAGETSEVIATPHGFTILRCEEVLAASITSEEEAKRLIREAMFRWEAEDSWQLHLDRAGVDANVSLDNAVLVQQAPEPGDVVARGVGGDLTRTQLRSLTPKGAAGGLDAAEAERVARRWFVDKALAQEARDLGLERSSDALAQLALRKEQLLARVELNRRSGSLFEPPSDEDVQEFFKAEAELFTHLPMFRLGVIRFPVDEASEAASEDAALAAGTVALTEGFSIAAQNLEGSRNYVQLDTGWISRRRVAGMGPYVLSTAEQLLIGQTSKPVRQDNAYWLLHLYERKPAKAMAFAEAKALARSKLESRLREQNDAQVIAELLLEAEVKVTAPIPEFERRPGARPRAKRAEGAI